MPSWAVYCVRCETLLATQDVVAFVQDNGVHMGLCHELFTEQAESASHAAERTLRCSHGDLWFTKTRQPNIKKRAICPFMLLCPCCRVKVGSQFVMTGWQRAEHLFDMKACAVFVSSNAETSGKERVMFKRVSQLMDLLIEKRLPVNIRQARAPIETSEESDGGDGGDGARVHGPTRTKTRATSPAAMVLPTVDSVREYFGGHQAHTKLSTLRDYQMELVVGAALENTIIYLPTGCGKTLVAVKTIMMMTALNPSRKAAFLVPTVPLVSQQASYLRRESDLSVLELSGQTSSSSNRRKLRATDAIVATPQFFNNLLHNREIALDQFCVLVFDEAHHAVKGHPYCDVLQQVALLADESRPRIMALTASPFGQKATPPSMEGNIAIQKLCMVFNASLNTPTIAADAPELQNVFKNVEWISEEACTATQHLEDGIRRYIRSVRLLLLSFGEHGDVVAHVFSKSTGDGDIEPREDIYVICGKLRQIQERICREGGEGEHNGELLTSLLQHLRKMFMVLPQLALQGPKHLATTLYDYFCRVEQGEIGLHSLVKAPYVQDLKPVLQTLMPFPATTLLPEDEISNKVKKVAQIIEASNFTTRSRAIVFVRRRKTAIQLAEIMEKVPSLRALNPTRFIGHNSFEGMSWQDEQKPTLERFRREMIRLLVATSVLEEGLDVPECSLVIQFDGITGMTSLVQSRGRARQLEGRFVVMCTQEKREKLQHIIDSELTMVRLARIAANDLKSKSAARQLISEQSMNGMMAQDGDITRASSKPKGVKEALAQWSVKERKFCVLLGSMRPGESLVDCDRDAALRAIRDCNIADIAAVDQGLNLVALDVVDENANTGDFISCYERLCCLMSFRIERDKSSSESSEPGFWMRVLKIADDTLPTDGSDILTSRLDNGATERDLLCSSFHRGLFITEQSFQPFDEYDFQTAETRILKVANSLVVEVGVSHRFEFDLRALHNRLIYKETISTNQWILYGTFFHAPKVWEARTSTRICADFHMKALSFAFHVNTSMAPAMRQLCKELVNFGVELRDTKLRRLESDAKTPPSSIDSQHTMLVYASQVLASSCCFAVGTQLPAALLETVRKFNDVEIAVQALLRFEPTATTGAALTTEFRDFVACHFLGLKGLAKRQHRVVLKVVVTPTRILFERPEVASENRVFRHFDPRHFLYVYFRDENRELLDLSDALARRFRTVMTNGIHIGQSHFQFLGGALSRMRNCSCIFTALDPQEVRTWMGELHTITSPAKYLKRFGQAFSSTQETITVHSQVLLEPEDDIEDDTGRFVFTDGCGEISIAAAKQVSSMLARPVVPSAFQIRLGGAKGVLVISNIGEHESSDQDTCDEWGCRGVKLRKSMVKFKAPHRTLEIVGVASAHSVAYLTRQSIALLSDLGIPDATFLSLQDEFIASLAVMLVSDSFALKELRAALPPDQVWWVDILYGRLAGDKIELDNVHRRIIHAMYQYRLKNTVLRARIPISKGRALMGVADFTGTLKYGEVFVQYSKRASSGEEDLTRMVVLSGVDVLVHRSPCYHPGDLRLLRCRGDVPPALKMLHDCIVFPTCGPRPHPDECTGGDLDGDMFTVIWDERLLPDRERIVPAMTLTNAMSTLPETRDSQTPVDSPRLIEFYLFSMEHNILGAASNAHIAVCDADPKHGSFSREAVILAKICAREVDFIKNPKHAEIVRKLSPPQYPDFMSNTKKPAYKSQKVLGKMYRRSLALFTSTAPEVGDIAACYLDEYFLTEEYLKHIETASIVYEQYKLAIRMLLQMSGARSEAELATGMIVDLPSEHRAEYFRFGERSRDAFYKTQLAFKKQFLEAYETYPDRERRDVAAAWYAVAYKDESEGRCLGFPWILADLLIQNKRLRCKDTLQPPTRALTLTGSSIADEIMSVTTCQLQLCLLIQIKECFATLLAGFHDRLQAITMLRLALVPHFGTQDVGCVLFGSSNLLTFEAQSDLDVVLQPVRNVSDLKALAQFASSAEGIANIKLVENTHVPVLSLSIESNWTIEISTSRNGPIKTAWFRAYVLKYPFFWPSAFFLLKWGKAAGLVRRRRVAGNGYGRSMFTPIGFMWLLLTFCLEKKFVELVECPREGLAPVDTEVDMSLWASVLERSQSSSGDVTAARVIMSFFSHFSDLATPTSAFGFDDPLDPINNTRLTKEDTEIFRQECYIASHQLIISNGDLLSLIRRQKDNRRRITLSRALSKHVHSSPEFHAAKIVRESGVQPAQVKLTFARHPNALRPNLYVADVEGDGVSVRRIEEKIERIEEALGMPQQRLATERFHRSGCSMILFEGALSQSEKIAFQAYDGPHQAAHQLHPLHQAHLTSFMNGKAWVNHAVDSFATKFIRQMVKLSHFEKLNAGQATTKAIARFGHHYLIHLPRSFHEESITLATIDKLEREFERGRASRELYESVMVARQIDRRSAKEEAKATSEKDEAATGGGGDDDSDFSGDDDGRSHKDDSTRSKNSQDKRQLNGLSMQKASAMAVRDRGVAHSFYPLIDPCIAPFLRDFALKSKRMHQVANNESYQVSIVRESCEFYVRLTPTLQLVNVKTRPCRWLSATLKMHQELVENGSRMDSTPDVRYYVSATEEVPPSDPVPQLLERACSKAESGQGVLQFVDDPAKQAAPVFEPKRVRVSEELVAEGVNLSSVTNVRHIRSTTYQSPTDDVEFRVLEVVEYSGKGFVTMKQKTEAEIVMPPLTPQARVSASFARRFLLAGVELVAFLREQQRFGVVDD